MVLAVMRNIVRQTRARGALLAMRRTTYSHIQFSP
ncbi:hypothetical protein ACVW1A_003107 [Bradyrhizobium sp. LB1.3]